METKPAIRLQSAIARAIGDHGEQTYPEECCGVLLGRVSGNDREIRMTARIENSQDENRERRFLITPEQYLAAENQGKALKLDVLGFYHSHPDHPAAPSQFDTDHAFPWFVYIIVSIRERHQKELTAWILGEDRKAFIEYPIELLMASPSPTPLSSWDPLSS